MKRSHQTMLILSCLTVGSFAGCTGGAVGETEFPETAAVTGKVTLDGAPVSGAAVTLIPSDPSGKGYGASAISNDDGTFEVHTYFSASHDVSGAVPGSYNVTVTKYKQSTAGTSSGHDPNNLPGPSGAGPASHRAEAEAAKDNNELPKKYESSTDSGLTITVTDGSNTLPLDLKSE